MGIEIQGLGAYRPQSIVSNAAFAGHVPNGIRERRHASGRETSVFMGAEAARGALEKAGVESADVDGVLCFSGMPDFEFPKDVNLIQKEVGLKNAACMSLDTACASFITALKTAHGLISAGHNRRILILCIMSWLHRGIKNALDYPTLGDGAAAVLVGASERDSLLGVRERTDSEYFDFITLQSPFTTDAPVHFEFSNDPRYGRYFTRDALVPAKELLAQGQTQADRVDWFIAHQTGPKMLRLWCKGLGIAPEKNLNTFEFLGNMSAVNIPASLEYYINGPGNTESSGRPAGETRVGHVKIKRGDTLMFFAPGAGMHLSAMLWQY